MLARFRRWRAYRRHLAALAAGHEGAGYRASPQTWRQLERIARQRAGY